MRNIEIMKIALNFYFLIFLYKMAKKIRRFDRLGLSIIV